MTKTFKNARAIIEKETFEKNRVSNLLHSKYVQQLNSNIINNSEEILKQNPVVYTANANKNVPTVPKIEFQTTLIKKSLVLTQFSDDVLLNLLIDSKDKYYKDLKNIDKIKDDQFENLKIFRNALINLNDENNVRIISQDLSIFYDCDVAFNGENRGQIMNKKFEMFSVSFSENPYPFLSNFISAESLSKNFFNNSIKEAEIDSRITLHSSLKNPNKDSLKHACEIVAAKLILKDNNWQIYITADCDISDPEFIKWKGKDPIVDQGEIKGQQKFDFYIRKIDPSSGTIIIERSDLKLVAASRASVDPMLKGDNNYTQYRSVGSATQEDKIKDAKQIASVVTIEYIKRIQMYEKLLETEKNQASIDFLKAKINKLKTKNEDLYDYSLNGSITHIQDNRHVVKLLYNQDIASDD